MHIFHDRDFRQQSTVRIAMDDVETVRFASAAKQANRSEGISGTENSS